jgi:DNA-binding XRE family transcriptional regulator
MATFANSLKSEIARVARKEMKTEVVALRKAASASRSEIAALKKQFKSLQSAFKKFGKTVATKASEKATPQAQGEPRGGRRPRVPFGPAKLIEHRKKLGITQLQMAKLLDASTLSVHKWEAGSAVPRAAQLVKIAVVLKLGKRAAFKQLGL